MTLSLNVVLATALSLGSDESTDRHTVLHSQNGRLLSLPAALDPSRKLKVCVLADSPPAKGRSPKGEPAERLEITGASRFRLEIVAPAGPCGGICSQDAPVGTEKACVALAVAPEWLSDGVLRYRLLQPESGGPVKTSESASPEGRRRALIETMREVAGQPFHGSSVLDGLSTDSSSRELAAAERVLADLAKQRAESAASAERSVALKPVLDDLGLWIKNVKALEDAEPRRSALIETIRRQTANLLPKDGYVLTGLSAVSSSKELAEVKKAIKDLAEVLSQSRATAEKSAALAGTLADLELWIDEVTRHEQAIAARKVVARDRGTLFFEGELVFGGYRRTLLLNHDGSSPMAATTDFEPIAPHEHLLFYLQRPGAGRFQAKLESGDKKPFELISPALPNSSVPARWVMERIGDATNFTTGKDIALTINKLGEKAEMVRQIAIPVIESYRWLVTTGVYFSRIPRRTFYISDVANGTAGVSQTGTTARQEVVPGGPVPTATPSDVTTVTNRTETASGLKGVVALSEKSSPSAAFFLSYFVKPRVNRPGGFRKENLVPAIVLGGKLDAPLQEGLLGIGFEPIRGVQIIGGLVKGRRTERGDGVELGRPLLVSTTIPTIHSFGAATGFVSLAIDVKPIAAELEKLLGKLF